MAIMVVSATPASRSCLAADRLKSCGVLRVFEGAAAALALVTVAYLLALTAREFPEPCFHTQLLLGLAEVFHRLVAFSGQQAVSRLLADDSQLYEFVDLSSHRHIPQRRIFRVNGVKVHCPGQQIRLLDSEAQKLALSPSIRKGVFQKQTQPQLVGMPDHFVKLMLFDKSGTRVAKTFRYFGLRALSI
jgi:hypothetical protein